MTVAAGKDWLLKIGDGSAGVNAAIAASKVITDLTFAAAVAGSAGNGIQIQYSSGGTAGSEVVTVIGNNIDIKIQSGTSTATQIRTAFNASSPAVALASCTVTGTGSNTQTAPKTLAPLAGGADATSSEVFTTLAGLTQVTLTISNEEIDVTSLDSNQVKTLLNNAGIQSFAISGAGLFDDSTTLTRARTLALSQALGNFQIFDTDGNKWAGAFKIKSLEHQGTYKSAVDYKISLSGSGATTFTAHS